MTQEQLTQTELTHIKEFIEWAAKEGDDVLIGGKTKARAVLKRLRITENQLRSVCAPLEKKAVPQTQQKAAATVQNHRMPNGSLDEALKVLDK